MKKKSIGISVFGYGKKEKHSIYVSKKCCEEKHVDLLSMGEEGKRHYILIKDFILSCMIMVDILEENIFAVIACKFLKHFFRYWLQAFKTGNINMS